MCICVYNQLAVLSKLLSSIACDAVMVYWIFLVWGYLVVVMARSGSCWLRHTNPLFVDCLETALRGRQSMVLGETWQFTMPISPLVPRDVTVLCARGRILLPRIRA